MTELTNSENQAEPFGEIVTAEPDVAEETPKVVSEPETEVENNVEEPAKVEESTDTKTTEEPVLTDKGTKLDPNPESAAHQLAANAKKESEGLKQLLSNEQRLQDYMKEAFPKKEEPIPAKTYTAEDFENLEDVAGVVNKIQQDYQVKTETLEGQVKQLSTAVNSLLQGGRVQQIASSMKQEITTLQSEPELDSKNPDFIEGFETDIADMYHKLDFDEKTGRYKGDYSIADIGNRMISAARKARKVGSEKAQTVVKDKSAGKVVISPKVTEETNADKLDAGDSIALGISKLKF